MRLAGPIYDPHETPDQWIASVKARGYRAADCPVGIDASSDLIQSYISAAKENDIVIAEVGVWNNPISRDETTRKEALEQCKKSLALADAAGARCCVNVAGSLGEKWDGPCAADLTPEAFDKIAESVREIIDDVSPTRTFYTLETMPWMYPHTADSYLALLNAIDRPAFAVHFDPVNMINSPELYFCNGDVIRDFVAKLGPHIKSCHAKDILLQDQLTVHLDEVRPGCGQLDYQTYLHEVDKLDPDTPLILEHLPNEEEYRAGAKHVREVAATEGIKL